MAGLDPAITTRTELAKSAIPVSEHPMAMAGTSPIGAKIGRRSTLFRHGRRSPGHQLWRTAASDGRDFARP